MFNLNRFGDKSVSNVRRSLVFDKAIEKPSEAKPDRFQNGKRRQSIARRQLDFGKSDPSVLLRCVDVLPNRDDPDEVSPCKGSFLVKRTCFTFKQKTKLEELFQKKKFLNKNEKTRLAIELEIPKLEIQMWFNKRRQQWKKQRNGGQVDESRPCVQQENPQTPFPRPSQNAFLRVTTATAQFFAEGSDSLPGGLLRGREDLNPSHWKTLDNSSECCLCTPARVTYDTKHVAQFLRQE